MGWNRGDFNQSTIWPLVIKAILFVYGCLCVDVSHQTTWFSWRFCFLQRTLGFRNKGFNMNVCIFVHDDIVLSWAYAFNTIDKATRVTCSLLRFHYVHLRPIVTSALNKILHDVEQQWRSSTQILFGLVVSLEIGTSHHWITWID